jgi:folate-binding protein YgfZ
MSGRIAELSRRGVVAVGGADAEKFLDDLMTSDMPKADGAAAYGGLLTPQGKVLFDFIAHRDGAGYLFDLPQPLVADFVKRLTFYRLRAKVDIAALADRKVAVSFGADAAAIGAADPRLAALGFRAIVTGPVAATASAADYDAHRIALGVPEGGIDFAFGEAFPHDADMDQLRGVDFAKGCYVGQEVVSRMEHRGTARSRVVPVAFNGPAPEPGAAVTAAGKPVGTLGSAAAGRALALLRLDRAGEALAGGEPLVAGAVTLRLVKPDWARFAFPGDN